MIDANEWKLMDTAPKTGKVIEVNYGSKETPEDICLARWSDKPVCMGGPPYSVVAMVDYFVYCFFYDMVVG